MSTMLLLGLAALGFVAFVVVVRATVRAKGGWKKFALGLAAVVVVLVSAALIIPNFVRPRVVFSRNACVANLKQIDGAKATWALEDEKAGSDIPSEADLFGATRYIREILTCPQGGIYRIGAVNEKPTCSLGGMEHTCP